MSEDEENITIKKINKKMSEYKIENVNGHVYKRIIWLIVLLFLFISLIGWGFGSQLIFEESNRSQIQSGYELYFQQISLFATTAIDVLFIYYIMKKLVNSKNKFFGREFSGLRLYGVKLLIVSMLVLMFVVSYGQVIILEPLWTNNSSNIGDSNTKNIKRLTVVTNFILLIFTAMLCIHQI